MTSRKARRKRRNTSTPSTMPNRPTVNNQGKDVVQGLNTSNSGSRSESFSSKISAANYAYIRSDLVTIAVVSVCTFAFVVVMAFVI
tara:strand:- start:1974 stop:2231 length:258 start_codon:yes stop_codon:yes gene_type:complete